MTGVQTCALPIFAKLVELVISAPKDITHYQIFNGGSDRNNSTKQGIVDLITKYVPDLNVTYDGQHKDPRNYKVSFHKINSWLGFNAQYDIEYGIKEIIDAINNHILEHIDPKSSLYGNFIINYKIKD